MYIYTSLNARVKCIKIEFAASIKNGFFAPSVVEHLGVAKDAFTIRDHSATSKNTMLIVFFQNSAPFALSVIAPTSSTIASWTLEKHSAQSRYSDWTSYYFNSTIAMQQLYKYILSASVINSKTSSSYVNNALYLNYTL